ncbi:MAG: hypothetical protein ACXU9U_03225, partial [Parachlamydiaceae bacterium]
MCFLPIFYDDQILRIDNGKIIAANKDDAYQNSGKITEFAKVLQLANQHFSNSENGLFDNIECFQEVERRYVHIQAKIEEKSFFQRIFIYISQWWSGVNLDTEFKALENFFYTGYKTTKEKYLLRSISYDKIDPQLRLYALKQICGDVPPLASALPGDQDYLDRLNAKSHYGNVAPSLEFRLLSMKIHREITAFEKGKEFSEEKVDRLIALCQCMTYLVLESELPRITKQVKKDIANIVETNENQTFCSVLKKKYLSMSEKEFSRLLLNHQITFLPFVIGLNGLHNVYLLLKQKAKDTQANEAFYDSNMKQNEYRRIYNTYVSDINTAFREATETEEPT